MTAKRFPILLALPVLAGSALAAPSTGHPFYGDPPDEFHPWTVHDPNRPQPPLVAPGTASTQEQPGQPPSDAIILMDGSPESLAKWEADKDGNQPTKWELKDGAFQCVPGAGYVRTKEQFADCQLHVEWSAPAKVEGDSQGRGNSGIFLMGQVEVQVLDNYNNPTYADGFAGSVYGVNPPMANPLRAPGEWQMYDIIFRRPIVKDGQEIDPGRLTVIINGVVVQDATPIEGGGGHRGRSHPRPFPETGPLKLQDHGNPVRYRNIWYRPLATRSVEGGTDGKLTKAAADAKKAELAAMIRQDAAGMEGKSRLFRTLESLCYAVDEAALKECQAASAAMASAVAALPAAQRESKKGEIMELRTAIDYLTRFKLAPGPWEATATIQKIVDEGDWDEKKKKK